MFGFFGLAISFSVLIGFVFSARFFSRCFLHAIRYPRRSRAATKAKVPTKIRAMAAVESGMGIPSLLTACDRREIFVGRGTVRRSPPTLVLLGANDHPISEDA